MSAGGWRPVGGVDLARLSEARLQAHYAVQWLARAARAFVPPMDNDAHTNLGWNDTLSGFTTHPFSNAAQLALDVSGLMLIVLDSRGVRTAYAYTMDGRSNRDIRAWLGKTIAAFGLNVNKLDAPGPYEMPGHPIGAGAPYSVASLGDALSELTAWYSDANAVLSETRDYFAARGLRAPAVRCWPHHFDLDSLMTLAGDSGSVGAGFSPGDEYYNEPYFYVGFPENAAPPRLHPIGHWHTHEFVAAIAPSRKIAASKDPKSDVRIFLRNAVDDAIKALGTG